jgi:hypothetical protein
MLEEEILAMKKYFTLELTSMVANHQTTLETDVKNFRKLGVKDDDEMMKEKFKEIVNCEKKRLEYSNNIQKINEQIDARDKLFK